MFVDKKGTVFTDIYNTKKHAPQHTFLVRARSMQDLFKRAFNVSYNFICFGHLQNIVQWYGKQKKNRNMYQGTTLFIVYYCQ